MRLGQYGAQAPLKCLIMGNSGAGKTCLALGLIMAGYRVAIIDIDQKLRALVNLVQHYCPEMEPNIDVAMFGEQYMTMAGGDIRYAVAPQTYERAVGLLDHWRTDTADWGPVRGWDDRTVLILDSFSPFGDGALDTVKHSGVSDAYGQDMGESQKRLTRFLERLRNNWETPCHVVVLAHGVLRTTQEAGAKFVPVAPGSKLAPQMGRHFDLVSWVESRAELPPTIHGSPWSQRVLWTVPTPLLDVKVPVLGLPHALPIEVALPLIFEKTRGVPPPRGTIQPLADWYISGMPVVMPSAQTQTLLEQRGWKR